MWEVDKKGSNMVISRSYNMKNLIDGRSEIGTTDQHVFYRFGSVDCEHKKLVLERRKDPYFLSEADVRVQLRR